MKKVALALVLVPGVLACASLTPRGARRQGLPGGARRAATPSRRRFPTAAGCSETSGPIDQQQEDREISDPYRTERNRTASLGGNVLYVQSYRFKNLMKIDCPVGDTSPGCMDRSQSWYGSRSGPTRATRRRSQALADAPLPSSPGVFRFELVKKTPKPTPAQLPRRRSPPQRPPAPAPTPAPPCAAPQAAALKAKVLELMQEGVGTDVIARTFARIRSPRR